MTRADVDITAYILTGRENARTGKELARNAGINPRDVTILIERARRAGTPIVASCDAEQPGYYIAETAAEVESYCSSLHRRAGEIYKTRRALLEAAGDMPAGE